MRLRSKISKLYYIQKRKMQLGRNKASKMFSSMERGNHMSSLNEPTFSLGHPAIFLPRRRNESLLTPVRASNNRLNRDLCFSSAVNMLNKNDDSFTRSSTGSSNATNFKNNLTVTRDKFHGNSPTRSTGVGSSKNIDITDFNSTDPVARACLKSVASRRKKSKKVRKSTYDQMDLLYTSHGLRSPPSKSSMKPTKLESFTKKYPGKEGSFFLPGLEEEALCSRDSFFKTTEKKNKPVNNIKLRLKLRAEKDESLRKLSSTSNVSPREILSIPDMD